MKKNIIKILILFSLIYSHFIYAIESDSFCPNVDTIKKDPIKGNWFAQNKAGYWKTYDLSFANKLQQFIGAQWVGAKVGQLTCIYRSQEIFKLRGKTTVQDTLPILLVFHTLAFQPTKPKWKRTKRGVYNCYSVHRHHCPFMVNIKPPTGNIYQEAEDLKYNQPKKLHTPVY